jgi:beta-phosphoglucomutase-like phosphatase (HAD superfamily)
MIKAIIFDWGGVLIDDPIPGLILYCSTYLSKIGFKRWELQQVELILSARIK